MPNVCISQTYSFKCAYQTIFLFFGVPMKHVEIASCSITEGIMALLHHLLLDFVYASVDKTCCSNT